MRDPKTKALIKRMQKGEDAQLARRRRQVTATLRSYGPRLLDSELRQIEMTLAPAIGRIIMETK